MVPEAVEFFQDLQTDNTKAYWSAHKDFYEASVREPMAELLDELSGEFGPGRIAGPTGTYTSAPTSRHTRPRSTRPWTAAGRAVRRRRLTAALGYYMMTAAQLERYRQAVIDDAQGARLAELTERLRGDGLQVGGGQMLKTAPRGYPDDHARIGLLRCKGLICSAVAGSAMAVYVWGEGPRGGLPAHRSAAAAVAGPAGRIGPRLTSRPAAPRPQDVRHLPGPRQSARFINRV